MSELTNTKLGAIGKVSMCKRILKNQTSSIGDIPFYKISTFGGKADCYISEELFEEYKQKYSYPKIGDILISAAGTIGRTVIYDGEKAFFQDSNIVWIDNDESQVLNDFLFYFYQLKPWRKTTGSTIDRLYNDNIREIDISFPTDKKEQKRVVEVLKSIDSKISNNNRINAELESMAKTIYDYWFTQFDFPDENGKPYKSSGGKMVWNEELKREIPEGWGATHIGDITICHDSKRIPLSSKERENKKGEIPYYGATGIMDYVDEAIFDGDYVLMAEDGSVMNEKGNPILQRVSGKVWINNHAHVLEPSKKHCCKLLMMLLRDIQVSKIKTGSIQMKINQENMNKIAVPDIPDDLIVLINDQLNTIDKKILHNNHENQQLASLRDWLLPMLMNGQVGFEGIIDNAQNGNN